jgi:hypothetical protein
MPPSLGAPVRGLNRNVPSAWGPGPDLNHVELDLADTTHRPNCPSTRSPASALDILVINHAHSSQLDLANLTAAGGLITGAI